MRDAVKRARPPRRVCWWHGSLHDHDVLLMKIYWVSSQNFVVHGGGIHLIYLNSMCIFTSRSNEEVLQGKHRGQCLRSSEPRSRLRQVIIKNTKQWNSSSNGSIFSVIISYYLGDNVLTAFWHDNMYSYQTFKYTSSILQRSKLIPRKSNCPNYTIYTR